MKPKVLVIEDNADTRRFLQVMLGKGRPETAGFADSALFRGKDNHLA